MTTGSRPGRPRHSAAAQRGVILLFALIALVVLLIGAAGLIRSFNTSLFQAGNIGFKRDLQNQGEIAVAKALSAFTAASGPLATRTARSNALLATDATYQVNYSAQILSVDAQGIPDVLTRSDRTDQINNAFVLNAANEFYSDDGTVAIRYVVDRLCATTGDEKTLGTTQCAVSSINSPGTSSGTELNSDSVSLAAGLISATPVFVLYRLSARLTGPRNTQSFFQTTFSVPS